MHPHSLDELRALLVLLQEQGVVYFKTEALELNVVPNTGATSVPVEEDRAEGAEDTRERWRGMSPEDLAILGAS